MKILVASHKPYRMPPDRLYTPIFVGAANVSEVPDGYLRDDTGRNLSKENGRYNELTAIYWAKYNLADEDILGLVHYRRYLGRGRGHDFSKILRQEDILQLLKNADVILPKERNYFIETQEQHYLNAHAAEPYHVLETVLQRDFPQYYVVFKERSKMNSAHLFNMSIMKRAAFESYTDFLFSVLEKVDQVIDWQEYDGQDVRSLGFLAERLMDTWIYTNGISFVEVPVVSIERTNWFDKGYHFLKRHFVKADQKKVHF
jgi:hypothetical protein